MLDPGLSQLGAGLNYSIVRADDAPDAIDLQPSAAERSTSSKSEHANE